MTVCQLGVEHWPEVAQRAGSEIVGGRRWPGKLHGAWRDVLPLERRSAVLGRTSP